MHLRPKSPNATELPRVEVQVSRSESGRRCRGAAVPEIVHRDGVPQSDLGVAREQVEQSMDLLVPKPGQLLVHLLEVAVGPVLDRIHPGAPRTAVRQAAQRAVALVAQVRARADANHDQFWFGGTDNFSYLDVYDRLGLLRERSMYAHCIHLDAADRARLSASGASAAVCPTSNLFLGSGLFDFKAAAQAGFQWGLASDVGGGTSFSPFRTMLAAYEVARLGGVTLSPQALWYRHTLGAARAMGLDVPRELSITGFDDVAMASEIEPPLTTMRVDNAEIGRLAAHHLLARLSDATAPPLPVLVPDLIERGSVTVPRAASQR